jgi:hypothetical protein
MGYMYSYRLPDLTLRAVTTERYLVTPFVASCQSLIWKSQLIFMLSWLLGVSELRVESA